MLKHRFLTVLLMYSLAVMLAPKIATPGYAAGRDRDRDSDSDMRLQEKETINKSFTLTGDHKILDVDDVFGSIEVTGGHGHQIQVVVNKPFYAESKDRMDAAKKEVTLDITDQPDFLKLYVNGPFRCNCSEGCEGWHGDRGYRVKMDFQLQVPKNIEVKLKTVNSGNIHVQDVTGNFSVHNVNGKIEMLNVAGSGTAKTVNGPVKVTFREN